MTEYVKESAHIMTLNKYVELPQIKELGSKVTSGIDIEFGTEHKVVPLPFVTFPKVL